MNEETKTLETREQEPIPQTRMCRCGKPARFIKDYWVSEAKVKKEKTYDDTFVAGLENVCGIIRYRYCGDCISKIAAKQRYFNKRLNVIILLSLFLPFALATGKYGYDYFAGGINDALVPFVIAAVFTVAAETALFIKLNSAQAKRKRVEKGKYDDVKSIDALLDSLNYGITDFKKVKEIPSYNIAVDGDGRVNYDMERSGYQMKILLEGKISIEPMRSRIKFPFKTEEMEYVKRTYTNAGLLGDNVRSYEEKELTEKDFSIKNNVVHRYSGLATEIIIPENVTAIAATAFKNCKNCEKVVIPDGVSVIEKEAFSGCPAEYINLPSGIRVIKEFTFYRSGLKEIVIPEGVEEIGENAFCECFGLEKVVIPGSCKKVKANAFKGCTSLTDVTVGEGVESLGDYSFNGCTSLTVLSLPEGVYEVGNFAFEGCTGLEKLYLPDSIQFMGGRAFDGNTNMTIYGEAGSYAEQYATEQRKRFQLMGEEKKFKTPASKAKRTLK